MRAGSRRRVDYVIARHPLRFVAAGLVLMSLGNLLITGCLWAILRSAQAAPEAWLFMLGGAAAAQFVCGVLAVVAFGWSR